MAKDTGETMSTPVQFMIADIDRKIGHLTELRKNLQQFEIDFPRAAASLVPIKRPATANPRGPYKKRKPQRGGTKATAPRTPAARSRPDGADHTVEILAALTDAGGAMAASDLRTGVGAKDAITLRRWLAPLLASKKVIATGATASRRFSLAGRVPKEEL